VSSQVFSDRESRAIRAWVRLLRGHAAVRRSVSIQLQADHGLTVNDYEALLVLSHAEGKQTRRTDLAQELQLTASGPKGVEFPMQLMLGDEKFWLVYLFIPPLLTMRLFAEERSTGTLEVLMTAPLHDWQVVLSKFVACFAFYVILWVPTAAYLPVARVTNLVRALKPLAAVSFTHLTLPTDHSS